MFVPFCSPPLTWYVIRPIARSLPFQGHLIHIDLGFILGIAPGGAFSIETAPFKLNDEMVQVS